MSEIESRMAGIEERMEQAERRAGRWRLLAILLLLPAIALPFMAAAQQARTPDVVRARRVEVVDEAGRVVLLASSQSWGGQLDLWGATGQNTIRLASQAAGGDLVVFHTGGKAVGGLFAVDGGGRMEVSALSNAASSIAQATDQSAAWGTLDGAGKSAALCSSPAAGASRIALMDGDGREQVALAGSSGSGGAVRVGDAHGALAAQVAVGPAGGLVEALTASGAVVASLGATEGSGGFAQVSNASGAQVFAAQAREDGSGKLALADAKGIPNLIAETGAEDGGTLSMLAGGRRIVGLGVGSAGGLLNLMNLEGVPVVVAGAASDADGGAVSVRTGAGAQVVRAGIDHLGAGELAVFDGTGSRKVIVSPVQDGQ